MNAEAVEIVVTLNRTDLIIGEDTGLTIEVRNRSSSPVTIPDPNWSPTWPKLTLENASTGERAVFAPVDDSEHTGHFRPRPPEADLDLPPGAAESVVTTLLGRVRIPAAGSWRLEASIEVGGHIVTSPGVDFRLAPLDLRATFAAGAHSGATPFQHILWSQADGGGSILILTAVTLDFENHPIVLESTRIERMDSPAAPVLSVSPNGKPFPGMWHVWLNGAPGAMSLQAIYAMHGQIEKRVPAQPLGARPHALIGPVLHDFDEEDASRPGPADVILWSDLDSTGLVKVLTIGPDGRQRPGPVFEANGGRMVWGSAAFLADGDRRAVLAVEDRAGVHLHVAQWKRGATARQRVITLFDWDGALVGSGATLNDEDEWLGATILESPDSGRQPFTLQLWSLRRDARAREEKPIPFELPGGPGHGPALVGRSPGGRPAALIADVRGKWLTVDPEGRCAPLSPEFAGLGDPVRILWPNERIALIVFASPERGLSVRRL